MTPQRKKSLAEIRQLKFLKMSDLAELNGTRYSTIKHYAELGLLPYRQMGKRLAKYYPTREASKRLKEILAMRAKGRTLSEIIGHFIKV